MQTCESSVTALASPSVSVGHRALEEPAASTREWFTVVNINKAGSLATTTPSLLAQPLHYWHHVVQTRVSH